jgi:hypothetical protein
MGQGRDVATQLKIENKLLLPYAEKLWKELTVKGSVGYVVTADGGPSAVGVAYQGEEKYRRIVNLSASPIQCVCNESPCHHMVTAIKHCKDKFKLEWAYGSQLLQRLFDQQYFVSEYILAYPQNITSTRPVLSQLQPSQKTTSPVAPPVPRGRKSQPKRMLSCIEGGGSRKKARCSRHISKSIDVWLSVLPTISTEINSALKSMSKLNNNVDRIVKKASDNVQTALETSMNFITSMSEVRPNEEGLTTIELAVSNVTLWIETQMLANAQADAVNKSMLDVFKWSESARSSFDNAVVGATAVDVEAMINEKDEGSSADGTEEEYVEELPAVEWLDAADDDVGTDEYSNIELFTNRLK